MSNSNRNLIPKCLFLLLFLLISMGCSEKNEKAQLKLPMRAAEAQPKQVVTFIEFGSANCIPCKMMQPIMEDIEKTYKDQVKVVFYDVWTLSGRHYAEKYGIRGIPTQVFLDKNGKEYYRHPGFFPKDELIKVLALGGVE